MRIALIFLLCFFLASCGFQPRSDASLPEQLRVIFIKSSNPYGQFEHSLKKALEQVGIIVPDTLQHDGAILQIFQTDLTSVPSSVGTGPQATVYTVTFLAHIAIYDSQGHILFKPNTITSTSTMIVNAQQAVSSTNQLDILSQELQRDVITQIFAILTSPQLKMGGVASP